jgi:hypothetical protein
MTLSPLAAGQGERGVTDALTNAIEAPIANAALQVAPTAAVQYITTLVDHLFPTHLPNSRTWDARPAERPMSDDVTVVRCRFIVPDVPHDETPA